jgi:hypothetical protein
MTFSLLPNRSLFFLKISLITLLILFRSAAFLIPRPTLIPNFGPSSSFRLSRIMVNLSPLFLLPCKKVCRNSYSLLILTLLGYPSFFTGGIFSSRDYRSAGNGQPGSLFGAPPVQGLPSPLGGHPFPETVIPNPFDLRRLKRPLHPLSFLFYPDFYITIKTQYKFLQYCRQGKKTCRKNRETLFLRKEKSSGSLKS